MASDVQLLRMLRQATTHWPAGEMAVALGVERGELLARVAELCAAGFEIEDRPALGLKLVSSPDRLIADDLLARLPDGALVREVQVYEETDSTNDRAAALGRAGVTGPVAVFAEKQTAGRGRFGRRWASAAHRGLWFSVLVRPSLPMEHWARLGVWAAVAVANALDDLAGVNAQIKWPNDVLIGGKKVCGILVEAGAGFAVVGIGLNVNHAAEDFPPELVETATSVGLAAGRTLDRPAAAAAVLEALGAWWERLADAALIAEAGRRSSVLGKWIRVTRGDAVMEGQAEALDDDGRLLLRREDGGLEVLDAGEVSLRAR